jgi:cell filamentation protein
MDRYSYEYEGDSKYCYPGSRTLINLLNITDSSFSEAERRYTAVTTLEISTAPVRGCFDLAHLMATHKAIFADIFSWAGKLRDVNISKGNPFCQSAYIVDYATELFEKLTRENFLEGIPTSELPERLSYYLSEVNVLHPFREGNGRTQRMFIDYLARFNGWHLDFSDVTDTEMIEASALAFDMDYTRLDALVARIITPTSEDDKLTFRKAIRPKKK